MKKCGICGKVFESNKHHRKYCSSECARERRNEYASIYHYLYADKEKESKRQCGYRINRRVKDVHLYLPDEFTQQQIRMIKTEICYLFWGNPRIRANKAFDAVIFSVVLHCSRKYGWGWVSRNLKCGITKAMRENKLIKKPEPNECSKENTTRINYTNRFYKTYKTLCNEIDEYRKVRKEYYGWSKGQELTVVFNERGNIELCDTK
ncbi:MAG: hypothetical protein B5M53_00770 [Candidatus Cloacimonas sp. 4484_209]|nr:MAG: hypothetical protein B5M53_00770 [Candidatus Cloacimonas sp. 4484_209]